MKRQRHIWKLKGRELRLGERTLIMAVLNVTPDSFSDGGRYFEPDRAFARALELEDQGADILDIGAESTRPGSRPVPEQEELRRLVPVLRRLRGKLAIPVSVDTYKAPVAERALELGAEIVNDPSGLTADPQLVRAAAGHDAGLVLNHMRGTPSTWAKLGPLPDVMGVIVRELEAAAHKALLAGLAKERVVLDPGFGFGKRGEQNFEILARLPELARLGFPLLAGPSRKSFLGESSPEGRLMGTAAAVAASVLAGAHIVRVHDVREMKTVVQIADSILAASESREPEERRPVRPRPYDAPPRRSGPRP
jgi:dihydropteroate synthase